jgi:hypothetical protein
VKNTVLKYNTQARLPLQKRQQSLCCGAVIVENRAATKQLDEDRRLKVTLYLLSLVNIHGGDCQVFGVYSTPERANEAKVKLEAAHEVAHYTYEVETIILDE